MKRKEKKYIYKVLKLLKKFKKINLEKFCLEYDMLDKEFNLVLSNKSFSSFTFSVTYEFKSDTDYYDGPIYWIILFLYITIEIGEQKYLYRVEQVVGPRSFPVMINFSVLFLDSFAINYVCIDCNVILKEKKYNRCIDCLKKIQILEKLDKTFYPDIMSIIKKYYI